jgi:hypothetical protein
MCLAQTDVARRDNVPNTTGEIGGATGMLGKLACAEQPFSIPGLRLPLR